MKFSIAVSTQPTRFDAASLSAHLKADLARIADMGYDGVELAVRDPSRINVGDVVRLTREYGLDVSAIGTGQAWTDDHVSLIDPAHAIRRAAIDRIKGHIDLAADTGARSVIIGLIRGMCAKEQSCEEAMVHLREGLQEVNDAAVARSIFLAIEPINRYETSLINTVAEGLSLIQGFNGGVMGLLLDTFHMNIEEVSIEQSIRSAAGHILHFHVADSNRRAPGSGHIDFDSILGVLHEVGYTGYVSGEFMPLPDALTAARQSITFLKDVEKRRDEKILAGRAF